MAYVKKLFNENFLQYASYVIKDRAIPDVEDGLKPVQRRILHTLFEMDDGKFHKVANVVGSCMKYHPHGDQSIGPALVVLANKELFIDKQGNFGNLYTGDEASASRYIECRANGLAKDIFYNPAITEYIDSYDGRNKEPRMLPAKIPVILAMGADGIAVGMATKILPHNTVEIIKAEIAHYRGKKLKLYPDFPTGGLMDVSDYQDGMGKVLVRARIDTSDPKRVVIRDLPFGSTTETLINSIEAAAKAGRIKIAGISDFTTDKVEIEIKLARGEYAEDTVDALYAFTECEQSISCNLLVIKDGLPVQMRVSEVIAYHADRLVEILKRELKFERNLLEERAFARTLERIFIEERIYKEIEKMKTEEAVYQAVFKGFKPYQKELPREVTQEDIDRLLKIPIRRISLYDLNKARTEMEEIRARIKEIDKHLRAIVDYAVSYLEGVLKKVESFSKRRTEVKSFSRVDVKEAARRDVALRYDPVGGYLGTAVSGGQEVLTVSPYDRVIVLRKSGVYTVLDVPEKLYVDKPLPYVGFSEKEILSQVTFSLIYRDPDNGHAYIKRFSVEGFILNKDYLSIPDGAELLAFTTAIKGEFRLRYAKKKRDAKIEESFNIEDFAVRGAKAQGMRISNREVESAALADASELEFGSIESVQAEPETESGKPAAKKAGRPKKAESEAGSASRGSSGTAKKAKPAPKKKKS
jgi:topoisomerase-4 subunit A